MRLDRTSDSVGARLWRRTMTLLPFCGAILSMACERGEKNQSDGRSTAANTTKDAPATITVYKVTKELLVEGACDVDKATPSSAPLAPFVVVGPIGGIVGQSQITGCEDAATCERTGKRVAEGESLSAMYMMPLDQRATESSAGGILYGGKHMGGKCTGVHEERVVLTESGSKGRVETRELVYEDYEAADVSDCSAVAARKKSVPTTCKSLRIFELEKASNQ